MKIMVFDVSAESGGALSILNDFYSKSKVDENNSWIFVISKPELKETENTIVLRYPWIKRSWLHRLYFDNFIAHKLIKTYGADEVLSLQNVIVPHTNVYQTVYVHNSLPFVDYKFTIYRNKKIWIYQNILSKIIFSSIRNADKVIVQTNWMKKVCINKLKVNGEKIEVQTPKVDIEVNKSFEPTRESLSTFFYPASGVEFKNHKVIVEACLELKEAGIKNVKVIFTLKGNENENITKLYKIVKEHCLPVDFIGSISRQEVFGFYSKAVLIFSSYIETVGLPLIEAKMHKTPILASDCVFSREILDEYDRVSFFDPFNYKELANKIYEIIDESSKENVDCTKLWMDRLPSV